jgi:hypothetical protein
VYGPKTAGTGGLWLSGSAVRPGIPGRQQIRFLADRNDPEESKVGVEVAIGLGVVAGAAALKAAQKAKPKIKRRFGKEVKSALEEYEQAR